MSRIDYDLTLIKGIVFDVDGVLSPSTIPLGSDGQPSRMVNIKDGYALQLAVRQGYHIAVITGAASEAVRVRFNGLGITDVYLKASMKLPVFNEWMASRELSPDQIIYVGDDIPDYECMQAAGLAACPADAATDIREIARYISPVAGGYGVARDILEQIMRADGKWLTKEKAFGW